MLTASGLALSLLAPLTAVAKEPPAKSLRSGQVRILRDAHGMPHVYASTTSDLFYGYGYAVAQDRLFQMEMARRSTQGKVAAVLGEKFVAFDRSIRGNFSPERIQAQLDALPRAERDILGGYAAGMNAWIAQVRREPAKLMPKQFTELGFEPADWTAYDVAMIFVGTMANRFSDMNGEIDNLALLTALDERHGRDTAWQIFNQLKWQVDPKAPTTVAPEEGSYQHTPVPAERSLAYALPRYDGTPPMLERLALDPADRSLLDATPQGNRSALLAQIEATGVQGSAGFPTTSNMWIVGRDKARGAKSILVNGPQFGWFAPAYTYGIGLHGAGFDIVGNTPFAYPCILFGHNGRISWGSTAGVGDGVDIFAEKLDPADSTRYWHDGQWKRMEKRSETIEIKGSAPVTLDVYRTVHGLVTKVDAKNGVAYAKARTWEGFEIQSLLAWTHKGQARNWNEWKAQAERHALTINWYYTDREGNIGYAHTGFYPQRRPGHDPRLPVTGTGEMDWLGRLPFASNPQVYNPRQGYIANWNNSPMKGYPSTDLFAVMWTQSDRLTELEARLREKLQRDGGIDADGMWSLLKPTSLADVNLRHFLPFLQRAVATLPADDPRARRVAWLAKWNGMNSDEQGRGSYDHAGGALLDAWLRAMLKATLAQDLPGDFFKWYASAGYATPAAPNGGSVNVSPGGKVLFNVLAGAAAGVPQKHDFLHGRPQAEVVLEALDAAWAELSPRYGEDLDAWRVPVAPLAFMSNNFFGVPQGSADEARRVAVTMNRGTENNMTVFTDRGVRAFDVVAPGQSGFIAPDGTASPHARDQFDLYVNFGNKPVWFTDKEVQRNSSSVLRLQR
ncbi:MAG: hypothetical protein RJA36_767 [Pseudomonadota bacterium]|jgi:penicillin amidase